MKGASPRILLPCAGFPGPLFMVGGPQLGAGGTGTPAPLFPPLGGASTCRRRASRSQAERLDRRMRLLDADTARPAVLLPAWTAHRGGVPGRKLAPQLMQRGRA
jgi:hypothetical protein